MAYIVFICTPLISVLRHTAGLPVHQLAGHAANIDFWVAEVRHRLDVIDGYQRRCDALRFAQESYQVLHGIPRTSLSLTKSTPDQFRKYKQLRRELVDVMEQLLHRAVETGVLEASRASELRNRLAVEPA